jgi:hypothetical protein
MRFSVWLLPAAPLRATLATHVDRIAQAIGAPAFPPHATLLSDFTGEARAVEAAVAAAAARAASLVMQPERIAVSPARFEALTVRLAAPREFRSLGERLASALRVPVEHVPSPHLSLAYPRPPFDPAALLPLAGGVPLAIGYPFDSLCVVDPGGDHWQDVAGWRVRAAVPLAGANDG